MEFKDIFGVFSRRRRQAAKPIAPLTPEFRNRVLMLCLETFQSDFSSNRLPFWEDMHTKLKYLVGRPQLSRSNHSSNLTEDVLIYLQECNDESFLDFVELIFKTAAHEETLQSRFIHSPGPPTDHLVEKINDVFRFDDLPYALTRFVREMVTKNFYQSEKTYQDSVIIAYPQVIRREDEVTHTQAIEPTLALLRGKGFESANKEFLEALADYRKGDFGDCLTKCGSAFESTMKIICHRKGFPFDPNKDTAGPLIQKLIKNALHLESYFDSPLMVVATLRNKLSKSHGAGTQQRTIPPHVAKYAINATAAAILLLVEEFSP
jgi:hypothetical protein